MSEFVDQDRLERAVDFLKRFDDKVHRHDMCFMDLARGVEDMFYAPFYEDAIPEVLKFMIEYIQENSI